MTRGFITIATGKEMYFQFARNLLLSYRLYSDAPLPFAIMCDRENAYTALFDDVVLFEKTEHPATPAKESSCKSLSGSGGVFFAWTCISKISIVLSFHKK